MAYILLATYSYLSLPGFSINNILLPLVLVGILGLLITHLMRLFIIKTGQLQQNIPKQIGFLFLTAVLFALIYASISIGLMQILHLGEDLLGFYTSEYKMGKINGLLMFMLSDFIVLCFWTMVYFSYHYVAKSQEEKIERIRLESKLKIKQLETEKSAIEYQRNLGNYYLMALRYQMNPHFIFNCLNSIQLYTTQNDTTSASEYLTKFSKLIRLVMENSAKGKILLASELDMLRLYIDLEAMRFKEKLQYTIHLEKDIEPDYIELPPLLLQPYVENAIWHGLMPKEEGGKISIEVAMNNDKSLLRIIISDNGIGRAQSEKSEKGQITRHEPFGMKVTSDRIALINQVHDFGANVTIEDLMDKKGKAGGTRVIIQIPV